MMAIIVVEAPWKHVEIVIVKNGFTELPLDPSLQS